MTISEPNQPYQATSELKNIADLNQNEHIIFGNDPIYCRQNNIN